MWLIDGASGRRHGTVPRVLGGADDCVFVVGPAYEVDPVLLAQHGPCRSGTSCERQHLARCDRAGRQEEGGKGPTSYVLARDRVVDVDGLVVTGRYEMLSRFVKIQ